MNEEIIKGLWSASTTLANNAPLNKEETEAISKLLKLTLGISIPTVQEFTNCQEAIKHLNNTKNKIQKQYFESIITTFEKKYFLNARWAQE